MCAGTLSSFGMPLVNKTAIYMPMKTLNLDDIDDLSGNSQIRSSIKEILREHREILIICTKREFILKPKEIVIAPSRLGDVCTLSPSKQAYARSSYYINNIFFKPEAEDRFIRQIVDVEVNGKKVQHGGIKITLQKPLFRTKLCDFALNCTYIVRAVAELHSNKELANPNSKPRLKIQITLMMVNGEDTSLGRYTATLDDNGNLIRKGKPVDAINTNEVAHAIRNKLGSISE